MRNVSTRALGVFLAGLAIGLIHCSTSSSKAALPPPLKHIPSGSTCGPAAPTSSSDAGTVAAGPGATCTQGSDCTNGPNGFCFYTGNATTAGYRCFYDTCSSPNDCASKTTCACTNADAHVFSSTCVPSDCRFDTDCGSNGFCSPTRQAQCNRASDAYAGAYCHTPQDECNNDSDCNDRSAATPGPFGGGPACIFSNEANHWLCEDIFCPAG